MAAQLFLNGLVTGLLLALPALALILVFGILRFANFAVGALLTLGAYAGYLANVMFDLPLALAAAFAALAVGLACVICDARVFEHSQRRPATLGLARRPRRRASPRAARALRQPWRQCPP
ncbi:hypothetical protein [Xanthobacter sp. KR7-225]|uniref:ABC transporter permease subunit n=1 Tax=Xanthobacter sp. KR7-225 TaxID=3156613 RepID=UPI0032B5E50C